MRRLFATTLIALLVAFAAGCVATAPIKVVTTGAKAGVKATKVGVKTAVKAGKAVVPDGDEHRDQRSEAD